MTLGQLNRSSPEAFRGALGGVFEHSPWIAERVCASRPFASVAALHAAMVAVVRGASSEERLALLRAHPDLAGRAARAGTLTTASAGEQSSAGLDRLTDAQYARFGRLNAAYREKFGFPFVIAAREHDARSILAAFEARLARTPAEEMDAALREVFTITRLRIASLIEGGCAGSV